MSNLIITIIAIALVAVAAIMGIYYGGIAYQQGQTAALAAKIVTEAQQILAAQRLWATNNNQPDATGVYFTQLVSAKTLSNLPYGAAAVLGLPNVLLNSGFGVLDINSYPAECVNYNGTSAAFIQETFTYNNGNYVLYAFYTVSLCPIANAVVFSASDASTVKTVNYPLVQLAQAINASLNVPANTVMTAIGIPRQAAGATAVTHTTAGAWFAGGSAYTDKMVMADSTGTLQSNYCYFPYTGSTSFQLLACVFGPS